MNQLRNYLFGYWWSMVQGSWLTAHGAGLGLGPGNIAGGSENACTIYQVINRFNIEESIQEVAKEKRTLGYLGVRLGVSSKKIVLVASEGDFVDRHLNKFNALAWCWS